MITSKKRSRLRWFDRKARIRRKVRGTADRPRMTVFKSAKYTYVQVIDDTKGHTLVSASTNEKQMQADLTGKKKLDAATVLGEAVAERCQDKNIEKVVFDRNGYLYHGRVAKLADAARKKGLVF